MQNQILFENQIHMSATLPSQKELNLVLKNWRQELYQSLVQKTSRLLSLHCSHERAKVKGEIFICDVNEQNQLTFHAEYSVYGSISGMFFEKVVIQFTDFSFKDYRKTDQYFHNLLTLLYSGMLCSLEEIKQFTSLSQLPLENENTVSIPSNSNMTLEEKIAFIHKEVGNRSFEIFFSYGEDMFEQSYYYVFTNQEYHNEYIERIAKRSETHNITIRPIFNNLVETYKIKKGLFTPKKVISC